MFTKIAEFIRLLYEEPKGFIPLHAPIFNGKEKEYLLDCIDSTFVSSVGKYVDRFEDLIAEYTGSKKAIATVNGTCALHIALIAAGVKPMDEVITQPLTFVATANAISYTGAKPIFLDVDRDTLGLSPEALKVWLKNNTIPIINKSTGVKETVNITTKKRISAIVPMHTFGFPCRIDEIAEISDSFGIPLIEDAAESLGSFFKKKHTGTFGLMGIISFNGNKIITTGGGGMILTNNENLGKNLKHLTSQAKLPHKWEFIHDQIGFNYRMPNINAALGIAQMEKINDKINNKRQTASKYLNYFTSLDNTNNSIKFVKENTNSVANYWLNSILFENKETRNDFLEFTNNNGIMTRPTWRLLNKLSMFKNCQSDSLTNATWIEERLVNLPSSIR